MRFHELTQLVSESSEEFELLRKILKSFGFSTKLGNAWWYNLVPYKERLFSPIYLNLNVQNPKRITYSIKFHPYRDYYDAIKVGEKRPTPPDPERKGATATAIFFPKEQPPGTSLVKEVLTSLSEVSPMYPAIHVEEYLEEDIRIAMGHIEELNEKCKEYLQTLEHTGTEEQQDITNI